MRSVTKHFDTIKLNLATIIFYDIQLSFVITKVSFLILKHSTSNRAVAICFNLWSACVEVFSTFRENFIKFPNS